MALEWSWWKDWWRLRKWRHRNHGSSPANIEDISDIGDLDECCCDECYGELSDGCDNEDGCMGGSDLEGEGKQVLVGVCAMAKKSQSKPMKEILTRLEEFEYIKILVFPEEVILKEPVEDWPIVDCLISFHSKGFPLDKAIHYANLRNPFIINNLPMQYDIQDRRRVYAILDSEGIEIPRYAVLDRDSADPKHHELVESEDHVEVNGVTFNKPFVEKPVSAEDHNIYIYYPTSAGGGSQRLFRKIGSRSSVYSPESRVRKTGSYIYEDFMPTDGTDVKVYTVGPDYAHAEARKSPALDGKVERDSEGKEIRYPVILSNAEKLISRKVCLAFKQTVCGFDLLRANGKSFVCDVNGFSFVKNSNKYYDDCAKILGNMILRELAPTLHIPWSVPFQLDDPPIVPTTFGKMMELRCVVAVIRHGDRTPKQKMKVEVRHPKFFEIFAKYDGYKHGHVKLKRPKQLQEILDTARSLLTEIQHRAAGPELEEKQGKLEQLKSVLEMYGHFSGINRKVQMKYQPRGRPRGSSSDDGNTHNRLGEPSLVLILKWGGELTPAGRIQAEELGRIFRCMYPGGQGRHLSEDDSEMLPSHGEYAGAQGLGLLRLHSTFRHDLKIYASDEGRVQMTAAAFAKGLLALEGELTPILVQMVKSANTNGLLDNDCDSSKYQNMVKTRLHELLQQDREFTREDREQINPGNALSINDALDFVKNPVKCCQHVQALIQKLMDIVRIKKDDLKTKDAILYHGETWELMGRRWGKIEKDFCTKNKRFDISKIPDIYDCIKYDLQHNNHTLQFDHAEELYIYAKYLADIVIPQEYGLTVQEKLTIGQGICTPLLKKIRADLQRNIEESGEETVNRLNPRYSHGVSSPGRHVRTRLYFTSESHVHSLLTVLRYGGLLDVVKDEQWRRAMEYVSMVSELNYMSQIVVMLYEDPTKDPSSEERFHVELHFSPGVNCCVQKNLPPGPGFRPHSRNESSHNLETTSQCSTRIEEEDTELGVLEDDAISPQQQSDSSPPLIETEEAADSTLDSPTTSRAIDMMDLDPNMMDEPYDSGFLQGSAPIPISARTVAGHEAARLGSQLAASQRQRREREASSICEPRARSYDHQRQDKPDKTCEEVEQESLDSKIVSPVYFTATKIFIPHIISDEDAADKLQYQSLDAVNKEDDQAQRRRELDDMFYERVDNLVGSHSPRAISHRYSPSCLATPAGLSVYSSSPDLSVSLLEAIQPCTRLPVAPKRRTADFSPTRERKIAMAEIAPSAELSLGADREFWDFGETQLLEGSSTDERLDEPKNFRSVGKEVVDSGKESVESKMAPDLGEDRGEEPRGFFRSRKGALERSSSRNVPAVSKESSPEVASAIERSEPRAAPDSRTTSSYEPNSLTRRSRKLPEDRMSSPECDLEISSSRKVPAVSGVDSELPSKESSPQVVPVIERSEPRAAPDSRTTSSYEPNSLTRRSRKLPQDRMSSPECDLETSSSRKVPAVSGVDSELPSKESSPQVVPLIERSEPRAAPDSRTTSSYEPNSLTRRSRKLPQDRMSSPECDLETSSSRKVPAVSGVDSELPSKESSPQVVPLIERSEPRAAPDSRTTSSYEPNSLTRRSRKLPEDRMSSPECDLETSSSRKVPAVSGVDSELPSKGSSPQVVPLIERSEPRAAPDSRTTSSYERNSLMTRSPSCLGIPVSLPHSVSSPELPAPAIVTILESSGPLVTLHNKSLASTSVESPRTVSFDRADDRVASPVRCYCAPPLLDSCKLMPPLALRTSETKRYGRSKSALALPTVDDACGESPRRLEEVVRCPLEAPDFQRSPCQRCRVPSEATGHPPYPKAERSVSLNFEPNSGSSTLNPDVRGSWPVVPGSWDESPIRPAIEGSSFPPKILRSVSQTCPITSLHPDGCIRRASLTVPGSERPQSALDRSRSMSLRSGGETGRPSAYSTSLPSHPHPRHRDEPTFPGSKASEIGNRGDKWVESSNPQPLRRRSSLIVPTTGDEVSGSVFARRFRSLSPSPQTCHCYNCNVSTLIKQSLNLSPAERSNLQAYFDRSALGRSRSMSLRPDRETGHSTSLSSHPRPHHRDDPNFPGNESKLVDRVEAQRRSSLTVPASDLDRGLLTGDEELLGAQDRVFARRFRSLSPSPQTCLCYNCNVSTLIKQSVNLPPAERSNFQAYFDRSLSHKSINCSCYKLSVASAEASRRVSRSASPNSRDSREVLAGQASGHSFGRSLSCLDDFYCPENDNRRNLSAGICVHRIFDENSFVASLVSHRKSMRNCKFLERRRSTPHNLGSSSRNSCKLHGSVSSGPSSIRLNSGTDPRSAGLLSVDNPAKPGENTESNHFDLKKSAATGAISGPPDFGAVDLQVDHSNPLDESEASTVETPDSQRRSMRNGKFLERSRSTPQNLGSSSRNSRKLRGHLFSGPPLIRLASGTDPGSAGLLSVDHPAEPGDNTDSGYFDLEKSGSTGTMSGAPDFGVVDFPVRHSNPLDGSKPFTVETPVPSDHREESTTIIQADGKTPQESRHSNAESNPLFWYPVVSSLSVHRDRPDGSSGKCLKLIQQPDLVSIPREKIESLLLLPRQCSCPEISAESTQPQRTPRRFLSRQSSLETNASSSTFKTKKIIKIAIPSETANYSSADKKTGITQQQRTPRHFLSRQSSLDTNASSSTSEMKMTRIAIPSEIANYSLTDKKSETTRTRKLGLALLRQLSCPEIPADLACHLLARSLDSGESPNYSFADKRSETTRTRKLGLALLRQLSCPEIPADLACHLLARSFDTGESPTSLHSESSRYCQCTGNIAKSTLAAQSENPTSCCSCDCLYCGRSDDEVCEKTVMTHCTQRTRKPNTKSIVYLDTSNTTLKYQRYNTPAVTLSSCSSSSSSNPRLQTQRSFSSPDTRPSIIQQPDPTCTARRHRHSISGQMSYFKLLGYNVSKKLTGSANSLFSTAVISGSSSAPNLKDMVPPHASAVAAIEGFGGVPPIRPLETLHNALSLRQLDSFLDMMTSAPLFRTPASSPPKFPSPGGSIHGGSVVPNLSIGGINREYHSSDLEAVRYIAPAPIHYKPGQEAEGNDLRNQLSPISPNSTGWSSEPQSFISSEPSSPAPTSAGECSMSMSLVSIDGTQPSAGGPKFSTNPCLDIDFNDLCMSIDQDARGESRGSISYTDYYSNEDGLIRKSDFGNLRERAGRDEISQDSIVDEDEEHTLTLRQTEEEQKRDVKFIFEQSKDSSSSLVKPGSSYKKIGRFRVESMEITDEDVRIKEAAAAAGAVSLSSSNPSLHRVKGTSPSIHDKSRSTASIAGEGVAQDSKKLKGGFSSAHSRAGRRGKTIARSQSVSTPQNVSHKTDVEYSCQASGKNMGSFSTMSCEDLENWKLTAVSPPASSATAPVEIAQDEPILTLASSLNGSVTVGFNVQDSKKD